jgi:hypothetical protein
MSFFKQFPLSNIAIGQEIKKVVDIFRHVDVNDILADEISSYQYYEVLDGERPDNVSQKLYGTTDYYWTFFILNESLKRGLDQWPKSDATIENEFAQEYDDIAVMTFLPSIAQFIREADRPFGENPVPVEMVSNTFNGLDLSYDNLRVSRNFETARIVKWDSNLNQLWLTDFSNRDNFFADPLTIAAQNRFNNILINGRVQESGQAINWSALPVSRRCELHFWFDDWQLIGAPIGQKSGFPGVIGSDGRLIGERAIVDGVAIISGGDANFRRNTMTKARSEWIEHLFEWHHNRIIQNATNLAPGSRPIHTPLQQYQNAARFERGLAGGSGNISIHQKREELLDTFYGYFVPDFRNGNVMFEGFVPRRIADGSEDAGDINAGAEHKFSTAREAPHHYYIGDNGYDKDNIVQSWQVLSGSGYERTQSIYTDASSQGYREVLEGSDPRKYITNYQYEQDKKAKASRIKVVRPDIIAEFARAYKTKLNAGLSRTTSISVTTPNAAVARAAGQTTNLGSTGGTSYSTGTPGGGTSSAPSGGGGGGGY